MPTLTIEAIRENPWNVVSHTLPPHPTQLLLATAYLAADYCRKSERLLVGSARVGDYVPPAWEPTDDFPDVHEENEARAEQADRKLIEISELSEKIYRLSREPIF